MSTVCCNIGWSLKLWAQGSVYKVKIITQNLTENTYKIKL